MNAVGIFDPASDAWRPGPSMAQARWSYGIASLSAGDGAVVVVGGAGSMGPLASVELPIPRAAAASCRASLGGGVWRTVWAHRALP